MEVGAGQERLSSLAPEETCEMVFRCIQQRKTPACAMQGEDTEYTCVHTHMHIHKYMHMIRERQSLSRMRTEDIPLTTTSIQEPWGGQAWPRDWPWTLVAAPSSCLQDPLNNYTPKHDAVVTHSLWQDLGGMIPEQERSVKNFSSGCRV